MEPDYAEIIADKAVQRSCWNSIWQTLRSRAWS